MVNKEHHERTREPEGGGTRQVDATVIALIPEYHQAKIRADDGQTYAINERTPGISFSSLRKGQHLRCVVTLKLPRVLTVIA
jgi:hypothetical protein